jgi:hypothetical protein
MWFRPERSATGTSVNTKMSHHPINIPLLEFRGNEVSSSSLILDPESRIPKADPQTLKPEFRLNYSVRQVHSNGKYGLRIFDVYQPYKLSTFQAPNTLHPEPVQFHFVSPTRRWCTGIILPQFFDLFSHTLHAIGFVGQRD